MTSAADMALGVVQAPPARPPVHGLIQTVQTLGAGYFIDDQPDEQVDALVNGDDGNQLAAFSQTTQRWVGGFRYAPEQMCARGASAAPCDTTTTRTPTSQPAWVAGMPVIVWATDQASTFGFAARDYRGRAVRALLASESASIAEEFWNGDVAVAQGWTANGADGRPGVVPLASSSATVLTSAGVAIGDALDILEEGIARTSNGQQGVIHCTPQIGSAFSQLGNTLRNVNGTIQTYRGTLIIADAGYPGTGPAGQTPGTTAWAYGTLLPQVRRGPIDVYPWDAPTGLAGVTANRGMAAALDRSVNQVTYRAERPIAVTVPPCTHVAVEVTVPLPAVVGG